MGTLKVPETAPLVLPAAPDDSQSAARAHVVQFYKADSFLIAALSEFVGGALGAGQAAVVIATASHREALDVALKARGLDVAGIRAEGRYISLDAAETLSRFIAGDLPDASRFADVMGGVLEQAQARAQAGHSRTAVFGEMVALLLVEGKTEAAIRLEQLWNDLGNRYSFSLRCAYPLREFYNAEHSELFLRLCAEHSSVIPGESYSSTANDVERLRNIALLQQQAQALETERRLRLSEQRFRLVVESIQDYAIFMLDREGYVSTWNTGAERIKGYSATEIIGKHFSCFYTEEERQAGRPAKGLEAAARDGRFETEGWRVRKDGSRFWANVVITALHDKAGALTGFAKITRDVTERRQAEEALRATIEALRNEIDERIKAERRVQESEQSLHRLSGYLLRMQDEERRRIARELHDGTAQVVTALSLNLALVRQGADSLDARAKEALEECFALVDECSREVRTVSYLMHPPVLDGQGLGPAIKWFADGFAQRSGITVEVETLPSPLRLSPDAEVALFRIVQESLTNVHRHSESPTASVRMAREGNDLIIEVQDSGRGMLPEVLESLQSGGASLGVGLCGMKERLRQFDGRLEIESIPDTGTTVRAILPLSHIEAKNDGGRLFSWPVKEKYGPGRASKAASIPEPALNRPPADNSQ